MLTRERTRIVIVDDHPVVHDGVAAQLQRYPDMVVVGHAGTGAEAVTVCAAEHPDVVLLDLRLPDCLAADVVPALHRVSPDSRILLFTAFPEHVAVAPTLAAGACGILVKHAGAIAIRDAIRSVVRTGAFRTGTPASSTAPVTAREYDVLRLVAAGHTNPEIGTELNLSINTVKTYLWTVMQKLAARNRAQLIANARGQGLL
ncbi:two-component system response regulator [Amycolatopsis mediterranei S699]|uniref:Two-component system response regulator n=2 Tax=Amycolatopsis mediterranei TaxID=33910 RepID=A0A0H3CZD2_AMYMU|nr:two-component system response regulator [Amycolatopsis mediterranei U32]AEK39980.1 two-component system response regulator [Amycolatopsis mediterranei S699]AGT82121.1 two-component system response regulator [Amycolatopsis mediterranei RB]KDO11132.1 transcriptional regulator [Amycolatopsis mediterranei]AFO74992.1 two-component system response regulator [Amycolatopsis mediterranei S699]